MANIIEKIAAIRLAILGKDVKESIADGIEAINAEVVSTTEKQNDLKITFDGLIINAGNSNAEIVAARKGEISLPAKIEKLDSSLAESVQQISDLETNKADKTDLNVTNANINLKRDKLVKILGTEIDTSSDANKVKLINLAEEVITAMAGTTPVNANVANESVVREKYAKESIYSEHLSFAPVVGIKSTNLFNKDTVTNGYYIPAGANTLSANASYCASDYIPIKGNNSYIFAKGNQLTWFDINKVSVGGSNTVQTNLVLTSPSTARYIRTTQLIIDAPYQQISEGNVMPPYEDYKTKFDTTILPTKGITGDKLNNEYLFREFEDRLILPKKMFFVDTLPLKVYKDSIVSSAKEIEGFKTALVRTAPSLAQSYQYFDDLMLDPNVLESEFKIAMVSKINPDYVYFKDIEMHHVPYSQNVGKTLKGLLIGDSLTQGTYMATTIGNRLATYSVAFTSIGTYATGLDTYGYCEGKGGWSYKNFIGKNNQLQGSTILPCSSGTTSTSLQNPFLKLANATDKANHPTWCFRNTGSTDEKSYSSDTDKTGDFYIFDFANYITAHTLDVPEIVTIGLGTNDMAWDSIFNQVHLDDALLGLDIIVKQIKTAYPNMKIGVIPPPPSASNSVGNNTWINNISVLIENIISKVDSYFPTYNNVDIVPIWVHFNRDFNWGYDVTTNLSGTNSTQKAHRNEYIHFTTQGSYEYSYALLSYILNVI